MLDIKIIRDNPEQVKELLKNRGIESNQIEDIISLDKQRREVIQKVESFKSQRNNLTKEVSIKKRNKENSDEEISNIQNINVEIKDLDEVISDINNEFEEKMFMIPNIPDSSVNNIKDDTGDQLVRTWGEKPKFDFEPKQHFELGEDLGILDFVRGAKVSGSRFVYYVGAGARLERAIYNFMLDEHRKENYTELMTPIIVNDEAMYGTGQFPKFKEDAYKIEGLDQTLIPTAEVPLVNYLGNEILNGEDLPLKYTAISPSFRKEAGSAGRDTRGLIRMHQFNKVEMVAFSKPEESKNVLETMLGNAQNILEKLNLPYETYILSAGEMGFSANKTYDINVWLPGQDIFKEISSVSNTGDFQARRLKIRYKNENKKTNFIHTLNGSGLAVGRTVAAIIENHQQKDGSIKIPDVLIPYFGEEFITKESK